MLAERVADDHRFALVTRKSGSRTVFCTVAASSKRISAAASFISSLQVIASSPRVSPLQQRSDHADAMRGTLPRSAGRRRGLCSSRYGIRDRRCTGPFGNRFRREIQRAGAQAVDTAQPCPESAFLDVDRRVRPEILRTVAHEHAGSTAPAGTARCGSRSTG